jgi:predicted GNAT family acetyltransferase
MEVRVFEDAGEFLGAAAEYCALEPFSTSVIGTVTAGVASGERPYDADNLWATVSHEGRVVGAAMHTPPFNIAVSRMPTAAAEALANALHEAGRSVPGVNGATETVAAFAETWKHLTGLDARLSTSMRLYYLDQLEPPAGVEGSPRQAVADDIALVAKWSLAFHREAHNDHPEIDFQSNAERQVKGGGLYLWLAGGEAVSMAHHSAPAAGVSRIGPVYTPPELRRHGYASAVTAAASQAALDAGAAQVILYTDLANPTSNSIYQQIGYRPDHDAEERTFVTGA